MAHRQRHRRRIGHGRPTEAKRVQGGHGTERGAQHGRRIARRHQLGIPAQPQLLQSATSAAIPALAERRAERSGGLRAQCAVLQLEAAERRVRQQRRQRCACRRQRRVPAQPQRDQRTAARAAAQQRAERPEGDGVEPALIQLQPLQLRSARQPVGSQRTDRLAKPGVAP